jgi:MerR family transcriptional regulator, light-induced transcriptional regulator
MEYYTLNELERLTGIKPDTIRMWEKRYGLTIPDRTFTNRRRYSGDDLRKLLNVSVLLRNGYRISMIAGMSEKEMIDKTANIVKINTRKDDYIDSLLTAMTSFDEAAVNEIMLKAVINFGIEKTFSAIVFPFLRKVGLMWHTGMINIGSEHFISNIFRRRLIAAFDNLREPMAGTGKKVLLFLPENELHELGLLYFAYIIRQEGHRILYLGQSTPLKAAMEASKSWDPDIVITGVLSLLPLDDPDQFLSDLRNSFPGKRIALAGALADRPESKSHGHFYICRDEGDIKRLLKKG